MNYKLHVSFLVIAFSEHKSRSGIARSYGSLLNAHECEQTLGESERHGRLECCRHCLETNNNNDNFIFSFLRNLCAVLHNGTTNDVKGFPFSTPFQIFIVCRLSVRAILASVRWSLLVALICISLIISNMKHLVMCLLAICMSSLGKKCLFRSSAHFFVCILYWAQWTVRIFWKLIPYWSHSLHILSSIL